MEDNKKLYPSLPSNYVTIVDLQKRWMQQKQQQHEEEEHVKGDKHEQNQNVLSNKIVHNEVVKPRSKFHKFNRSKSDAKPNFKARGSFHGKLYGKKPAEEFRVVEKASDSSGSNADTANHTISNVDEDSEEKNSQFQKSNCLYSDGNPSFGNRKPFYRNLNGKKRFKEFSVVKKMSNTIAEKSMANVAITTTEFDDQKVKDEKKRKKKRKNKKKNRKVVDECREDEKREKKGRKLVNDQTVEEKDNRVILENQTEVKDNQVIVEDQTVEEKDIQVVVDDQTVVKKDNQVIVENQTVEEKDNQVTVEDQMAEIEQKFKEVSVSRWNERSTAVMEGTRREYGGYRGGYRRGYGKRSWEVERGKNVVVDQVSGSGRSTAEVERWRGVHRGYRGKSFWRKGELMWVKKEDVC